MPKLPSRVRGFTLIELLIAIAIVAILAAIAVPSYTSFIRKGNVSTAKSDLVSLNLAIENAYRRTLSYPASTATATTAQLRLAFPTWTSASKDEIFDFKYEQTTATVAPAPVAGAAIKLTATGKATMAGCTITLSHELNRSSGVVPTPSGCN